jgi:hypothetical protein
MAAAMIDANPAGDGFGIRLIEVPENTGNDPRAQIYIVDHLDRGTTIQREIEIANTTATLARIALYPAAATITNGAFLGADGHTANDLSSWTSVSPAAVDVVAGGRSTATVTIAVPHDAVPGEQYGVIWAEAPVSATASSGVLQINRVGIRLYISAGGGGAPAADFTIESLTAGRSLDGDPTILATVHNTGGRALDMSGTLQLLDGPAGLSAGPFPAELGVTVAIGATTTVSMALDKQLPAGPWAAELRLRSGLVEHTARATITFPVTGSAPSVRTAAARPAWQHGAIAGLGAIVLVFALGFAASLRRSFRTRTSRGGRVELFRK